MLAEGDDPRVQAAARLIEPKGAVDLALLVSDPAAEINLKSVELRHPRDDPDLDRLAEAYREAAGGSRISLEAARSDLSDPLRFAGMMVTAGLADGAVAGAVHSTADVIRAALRSIGPAPGTRLVSGAFYMVASAATGDGVPEVLTFADAGVVPDPTAEQLAEIAAHAARQRRLVVDDEPAVAFLSYSTKGSAEGASVAKMRAALEAFRAAYPDVSADGELQADAALVESIALRKAAGSAVAGRANVLIFPDLDAGNIAYKLVERLAGATAIGPILHGLARPYNDLSRGASARDIELVTYVTALMAGDLDS